MRELSLYNTLSKKVEPFHSIEEGKVKMYTCGPTVYHFAHIGNLRSYMMEDVLEKYLGYVGYDVKRCMNITDVGHLTSDADTGDDKCLPVQSVSTSPLWRLQSSTARHFSQIARS